MAETAYDMAGCSGIGGGGGGREGGLQAVAVSGTQPADVREGLANAYNVVTTVSALLHISIIVLYSGSDPTTNHVQL